MTSPDRFASRSGLRSRMLLLLLGGGLVTAVVIGVLQGAEERAFVAVIERAQPWWLLAALALQGGTYVAQGGIWRRVAADAGFDLPRAAAFRLSLAKLFADQALPSGGVSSSLVVMRALEARRVADPAVSASVIVNVASYHLAYALALVAALGVMAAHGETSTAVVVASALFLPFAVGLGWGALGLAGRPRDMLRPGLRRLPGAAAVVELLADADRRLVRSGRLIATAVGLQLVIVLCDAATVWVLIRAVGEAAPPAGVFAAFMVASLVRTMGFIPGGLGTFEATSVVMLRTCGVDLAVALSATLLFRGISFWLPMLPGYWYSRQALTVRTPLSDELRPDAWWSGDVASVAGALTSGPEGLSSDEAARRLELFGPNRLHERGTASRLDVLLRQLRSPLLFLLIVAAAAAALTAEWVEAAIVLVIISATAGIGYWREYRAQSALRQLTARLRVRTTVVRDGVPVELPGDDVVPGDVVVLAAGSLVPADARLIEATDFFVSEAVLTGESFPVQKAPGVVAVAAGVGERVNCVFHGTNVRSGMARALVVATGGRTEFGRVAHRLTLRPPETAFDRGIRQFGYLLTTSMLVMVVLVFLAHTLGGRPPIDTLLFSLALAVGLSPELLPAVLSVNLARGAQVLAAQGVLVRRLNAIENLGSMDVLCTDKTGTLTEGVVELDGAFDDAGRPSPDVLGLGAWNAALETGVASPLDDAILAAHPVSVPSLTKLGEIPFDFVRKRVTVVVGDGAGARLVTKGAFHQVLDVCVRLLDGTALTPDVRRALETRYEAWSAEGTRVLAVAVRPIAVQPAYGRADECDLAFAGFLTFLDRPKAGVADAIAGLTALGVSIKLISGDTRLVCEHVARTVGLRTERVLTGRAIDELHDEALWSVAEKTDLFVEVDPNQKERIIMALRRMGHVVGFLGDGVNDAPAMHAADTALSVEQAVDVAREAADFVLLERGLDAIRRGIEEGRRTFANTLKYVLMTTSANLGNMVSMAAVSLWLPFLPMTAAQILLNNLLSDVPALGIADDSVDPELVDRPRRWDMRMIGRYMVSFGVLSSVFDAMTFAWLIGIVGAGPELFRTGWFVESLLTELVVALIVRTRRPFFRSRPGRLLLLSTMVLVPIATAIPYVPGAAVLGFTPLPFGVLGGILLITGAYVAATEVQKRWFYRASA